MIIKMNLNVKNIQKSIDDLKRYQKSLNSKMLELMQTLCEKGVEILEIKILEMRVFDTGELLSNINYSATSDKAIIRIDSNYAVYCEYGTGIVGKGSPHPEPWKYDVNEHGEKGWIYPKNDGTFGHTKGMPARPFFYETRKELKQQIIKIAEGILID